MLEDAAEGVKRYAPPPHRKQEVNQQRSRESIGGANFLNGVKNPSNSGAHSSKSSYLDTGNRNDRHKNLNPKLIPLVGCHNSDAANLLNERWAAAECSKDEESLDLSHGQPITYSETSNSSCASILKFPHQMDFLAELRRTIQNSGTCPAK